MRKEFMITEDGSHTIYLPEMDEHYHSTHGAIQESMHIYIGEGLNNIKKCEINILEIGFGTGLNAYLSYCKAKENHLSITYTSLEKYPLSEPEYAQLNYPSSIYPEYSQAFSYLHQAKWNSEVEISPEFKLHKIETDLLSYTFDAQPQFDLVYYDAFGPSKQPEMWTDDILRKVAATVKTNGIIVTYCAKGTVRRALSAAGFEMQRIPGPIGKKEILRGKNTI